jgi:hypothetical protein
MARALPAPLASCPRCESPRSSDQQYCMDCGLKLPPADGALASFRRGWIRWFGWYPGDWTFPALVTLLIAAAGAAAAVELSRRDEGGTHTIAAPTARPATNERAASASSTRPNGRTEWPAGESGWTVVLVSLPRELGRAAAKERAARAARAALPDVGFLLSDRFPSLHPGYYVVFTGIYQSRSEAEAAVPTARGRGFGGAYARPVVP